MGYTNLSADEKLALQTAGISQQRYENESQFNTYYELFSKYLETEKKNGIYPQWYGGVYYNNFGELEIAVKKNSGFDGTKILEELGTNDVKLKIVDYSFRELQEEFQKVTTYKQHSNEKETNNIKAWGINEADNTLDVYLDEISQDKIENFRRTILSDSNIRFFQAEGIVRDELSFSCGNAFYRSNGNRNGSIGYRAKINQKEGFITAAHCLDLGESCYDSGKNAMGSCTSRKYASTIDAAFVSTLSNYSITNNIQSGLTTIGTLGIALHTPPKGASIFKVGASTFLTAGTVEYTSYGFEYNGITWNLYGGTYASEGGDSGGLIYREIAGGRFACGIHKGVFYDVKAFTLASNVESIMQAYHY